MHDIAIALSAEPAVLLTGKTHLCLDTRQSEFNMIFEIRRGNICKRFCHNSYSGNFLASLMSAVQRVLLWYFDTLVLWYFGTLVQCGLTIAWVEYEHTVCQL